MKNLRDNKDINPLETIMRLIIEIEEAANMPKYIIMNHETYYKTIESPFLAGMVVEGNKVIFKEAKTIKGQYPGFPGLQLLFSDDLPDNVVLVSTEGRKFLEKEN